MYVVGSLHGVILPCLQSLSIPGQTHSWHREIENCEETMQDIALHCSALLVTAELKSRKRATANWFGDVYSDGAVAVLCIVVELKYNL